jgi:hypothetical protein
MSGDEKVAIQIGRGFYETSDVDHRGPGAAPDSGNGLVRSVGDAESRGKACRQGHP